jgi:hypothetical protein
MHTMKFSMSVLVAVSLLQFAHANASQSRRSRNGLFSFLSRAADRRRELITDPADPPKEIQEYELWEPHEIRDRLLQWADHYPDFVSLTTAQDAYGLPTAGKVEDCPFEDGQDGCLNYILTIQDFKAHPEGSESSNSLPEVLWSGEVHGNERVGPTAVLEAAQLLMDAATCEAHPRAEIQTSSIEDPAAWENELSRARTCRQDMKDFGISDSQRQWLARLATTRRIVIVPTANALGYFRIQREEYNTDPNRDFPYDLTDPAQCMQTIAARTLNEVFRDHLFQLSLTFHGGMEVVGYEWGAPSWDGYESPDDTAQSAIATAYSRYGGGWSTSKPYDHGSMNDLVYAVRGGMEDWAYAGSWDTERVIQCQPTSFGGYPAEKTIYNNSTLRVFNMLVETSNHKIPPKSDLGTSLNLLEGQSDGNGHVSRNIRLALLAADLVEPYLSIIGVNEMSVSDDIVPLVPREGLSCQTTKTVSVPVKSRKVTLRWTVGGALQIDSTQVLFARWSDLPEDVLDCDPRNAKDLAAHMKEGTAIGATSGVGRFSNGPTQTFSASIDISEGFEPHDRIAVVAIARVDQAWKDQGDNVAPKVPPQSHMVNARTDPEWYHESAGKRIQGRLEWVSIPLTIVIGEHYDSTESQGEWIVETAEVSNRFADPGNSGESPGTAPAATPSSQTPAMPTKTPGTTTASTTPEDPNTQEPWSSGKKFGAFFLFMASAAGLTIGGRAYMQGGLRNTRRSQLRDFIEDESAPSPGLQFKKKNGRGHKKGRGGGHKSGGGYTDIDENEPQFNGGPGEVELGRYTDTL